jgi:hypothetical protein
MTCAVFTDPQTLAWRPLFDGAINESAFIHPKTRSLIRASLRDTMAPEDVLNGALN